MHRGRVLPLLPLILLTACSGESTDARSADQQALEANERIVRKLFLEGFSGGNLDVIDEVVSPDIELHDPNLPPGIEGMKAIVRKNNAAFDDWSFTLHDVLAVEDKVAVRWTGSGVHANSFMGETPTGKEVHLDGLSIYQIAGSKIVTDWVIPDNLGFLIQLGVLSPLGMTDESAEATGGVNHE